MLSRLLRRAIRLALPRIEGGGELSQQVALNMIPFRPETVIKGYLNGFFPMTEADGGICWRAPEQRAIIPIEDFHVAKTLARLVRQQKFEVTLDTQFEAVIRACAGREETWITDEFISTYCQLHEMGVARSVEVLQNGELVGGLYGICLGRYFATESLFHHVRDASKVAFVHLFEMLRSGGFLIHDVQYRTRFLDQFGCTDLANSDFRQQLMQALIQHGKLELPTAETVQA
jgi:leucyl/phenylalanyl-tRNA--protein transferase